MILEESLRCFDANGDPRLPPHGYLAIVDHSPEVELGIAAARETASFHVICGTR